MSSRPGSRGGRAALGIALLLLLPAAARAIDLKLWPLFRYANDEEHDVVRWSVFGPLIEFTRTPETRELRIRPLLRLQQRRGPYPDDSSDVLFPLMSSRWQADYQSFRFLLFTFRTRPETPPAAGTPPPPDAAWQTRMSLPPFLFYRSSPEQGARLSVFPFYLDVEDLLGYERVRAIMFPAYVHLTEPRVERRYYGFPFVSTLGGAQGRGVRVWPFYGDSEIAGQEHTRYVLWPFHIRSERLVPGYGWERRRLNPPVFGAIDGAGRTTRTYGVFAYTHTIDERLGSESTGAPWPFFYRERALGDAEYRVWRVAPVYGRVDLEGYRSRFYAWPAYRRREQEADDFQYERDDVMLLGYRHQRQRNALSGREQELWTVFPVLRRETDDWRHFGQVPALADSLVPRNRGILDLWAPLYGVVRWDTEPSGERAWNVAWGLVAREHGTLRGPWHLELGPPDEDLDGG